MPTVQPSGGRRTHAVKLDIMLSENAFERSSATVNMQGRQRLTVLVSALGKK